MGIADALEGLAVVSAAQNDGKSATHLLGVAEVLCERIGVPIPIESQSMIAETVVKLKERTTADYFANFWLNGRDAALEKVLDRLLAGL